MTTALNLMRKERRRPVDHVLPENDVTPVFQSSDVQLMEALRALPHRRRTAALLYYVGDLPIVEIARVMDAAEGTVKALLSQARANLKQELRDTDG